MSKRQKAKDDCVAPLLESTSLDVVECLGAMHDACVADNATNNSLIKTFRAAGFLAFMPKDETSGELVRAEGGVWSSAPLFNNRITKVSCLGVIAEQYNYAACCNFAFPISFYFI